MNLQKLLATLALIAATQAIFINVQKRDHSDQASCSDNQAARKYKGNSDKQVRIPVRVNVNDKDNFKNAKKHGKSRRGHSDSDSCTEESWTALKTTFAVIPNKGNKGAKSGDLVDFSGKNHQKIKVNVAKQTAKPFRAPLQVERIAAKHYRSNSDKKQKQKKRVYIVGDAAN